MEANFTNEMRLIFHCAKVKMEDYDQREAKRLLTYPLNWSFIISQAICHGIAGLIYYNLNTITDENKKNIPQKVLFKLRKYYLTTCATNLLLWREFLRIQDALYQAKIKVIPLKGIILAETLYHNIGLRPMGDIDILVREESLSAVEREFLYLGFKKELDGFKENFWRKNDFHIKYVKYIPFRGRLNCEVHWNFVYPRPKKISLPDIWKRAKEKTINGEEILLLSPEDTFLSLTLHLIRRHTRNLTLKHISDIFELLELHKDNFDWNYVIKESKRNRIKATVYFALLLAIELLGSQVPQDVLSALKPGFLRAWLMNSFATKNSLLQKSFSRENSFRIRYLLLRFLLLDGVKDLYLFILLMPIEHFVRLCSLTFPSRKASFFYRIRYIYIFWRTIKSLFSEILITKLFK